MIKFHWLNHWNPNFKEQVPSDKATRLLNLPLNLISRNGHTMQRVHLSNRGILSYPVLPPSRSPPSHTFHLPPHPSFFPTCLFVVKNRSTVFHHRFSPSRVDQVSNKSPLGEKQAHRFSPSRGDQVSKIPRGKLIGSIFHHARGKISPPPGQNFTGNLAAKLATRFAKFRIKSHFIFHHKIHHKISPQDSPQASPQTR